MNLAAVIGPVIAVHVGCGIVAVGSGVGAMLTRKGSRQHRRFGRLYLIALSGLGLTAPVLAALDWPHRWHLAVLGAVALGTAGAGFAAVRSALAARVTVHITGMGLAYISMLTAFYVDNGPQLPLWNQLPAFALWLLPSAVGAPLIASAMRRRHRTTARRNHETYTSNRAPGQGQMPERSELLTARSSTKHDPAAGRRALLEVGDDHTVQLDRACLAVVADPLVGEVRAAQPLPHGRRRLAARCLAVVALAHVCGR